MDLNDAHVLITGASRGIGAAMAKQFAAAGARVSVAARSTEALNAVAEPIGASVFTVDLFDEEQTDSLIGRVEAEAGPIDVLMSNAGVEETDHFHRVDVDTLRRVTRINLEAPIVLTRHVLPGMLARNQGHLSYTSSLAGTGGFPALATYGATKAGLSNFAAALRMELRDTAITTTVIAPGPVSTDMWGVVEHQEAAAPIVRRLSSLQLLPVKTPEYVAKRSVAAVKSGRRHVRTPRRLSTNFWLREVPSRLTEVIMTGVDVGPKAGEVQAERSDDEAGAA